MCVSKAKIIHTRSGCSPDARNTWGEEQARQWENNLTKCTQEACWQGGQDIACWQGGQDCIAVLAGKVARMMAAGARDEPGWQGRKDCCRGRGEDCCCNLIQEL